MSSRLPTGVGTIYNMGQRYILFDDLTIDYLTIYDLFAFTLAFLPYFLARMQRKPYF